MAEIPKIATRRLQTTANAEVHPDPNLLTAFVEKSLGKSERVQVLGHLAQCANCREVVALSMPESTLPVASAPAASGWLSWPVLRWGAVAACVVIVGAAVTLRHRESGQTFIAARQTDAAKEPARPAARADVSTSKIEPANNGAANIGPVVNLTSPTAEAASRKKQMKPAQGGGLRMAPGPAEAADAATASEITEMVPGRAKDALAEPPGQSSEPNSAAAPIVFPPRPSFAKARAAVSSMQLAPNLVPRWTLSADGTLQRSFDSGRTWETIPVSNKTTFRALAANGLDIWVGGSGGALYHSSDAGQHWTQVHPAVNGESLSADIIGVEFTDAVRGKLTTSDEETWTTEDAGQSWQKQ